MTQFLCYYLRSSQALWMFGFTVAALMGGFRGAQAQEVEFSTVATFNPPTYLAYRTAEAPRIDGRITETSWEQAQWTASFVNIRGEGHPAPRLRTRAKMLWNERYFFVAAELEEPDLWATLSERDTTVWRDDAFEVFIDPSGDTHTYYELQMNALETVRDLFLVRPFRDGGPPVGAWDIRGIKAATHIEGTLNSPSDVDEGWTVELALPWKVLVETAPEQRAPRNGEQWRINFARPDWALSVADGAYRKEENKSARWWSWAPQGTVNMHKPERYGYVQFVETEVGTGTSALVEPPNKQVKWALRQLYYRQRAYQAAHGHYATGLSDLDASEVAPGEDMDFEPALQTTESMYEITAPGAEGTTVHIRHDGKVWTTTQGREGSEK